ncbi:binding-protein-dependent transport systems inner membrane component [Thermobaculum terrenum ATCC BAA-798]|uniref:Binding-protein-dependent transport systems inner membrane component n=1 Tax=Thermobaculum terrenum (strain ATCC BAA-798 / CCMEE 7001 / YNP1) TaxID=525904 RepID=D1CB45_THET1|nr:sugar ABC transporter permease [Thermobaculum terrenum]ACZ42010.1 binding-protein-dependent transport systems inner membrane component [Thermobaculum terrenum ATCC BAA-798]
MKVATRQGLQSSFMIRVLSYRVRRNVVAYLYIVPALVLFAVFLWWPILQAFIVSFQHVDLSFQPRCVGLQNFRDVITDPLFFTAWRNTLYYTILAALFAYIIPVIFAIAVNEMPMKSYLRTAFYLPAVLPPIVTALLWGWIYQPEGGLANTILHMVGLNPINWLESEKTVIPSILIMTTWGGMGGTMLYYLAALNAVPSDLYEAAELDGANILQRAIYITIPQIRPIMWLFLVGQIIGTMQIFTEVFALTDGGPNNASVTLMLLLYRYAFQYNEFGKASALGVILFIFLSAFSIMYMRMTFFKKQES